MVYQHAGVSEEARSRNESEDDLNKVFGPEKFPAWRIVLLAAIVVVALGFAVWAIWSRAMGDTPVPSTLIPAQVHSSTHPPGSAPRATPRGRDGETSDRGD